MMQTPTPIPLSQLAVGATARVHHADVEIDVSRFLRALGLTNASEFRLSQAGEPCIVQVRSTRIGLSKAVARRILVIPTTQETGA